MLIPYKSQEQCIKTNSQPSHISPEAAPCAFDETDKENESDRILCACYGLEASVYID